MKNFPKYYLLSVGDIVHIVYIMPYSPNYTADMMFNVYLSNINAEDNVKVYRYNGAELVELESRQKDSVIVFFTNKLGDFVFIKNN